MPSTDPAARAARPASVSPYDQELAKLRRIKAAVLQSCSQCEDYLADERRARQPEPVD